MMKQIKTNNWVNVCLVDVLLVSRVFAYLFGRRVFPGEHPACRAFIV